MEKGNILTININDTNIKKYIKNTKKLIKYCDKNDLLLKIVYDDIILDEKKLLEDISTDLRDIITIMIAINKKDKYERNEYIYDTVCRYLDSKIQDDYCMFKNDMCIRDRLKNNNHKNGCCECIGRGKCKYLKDSKCTLENCMACKLFTCHTLKKLGFTQNINDFVLTKYFFDKKEKDILQFSFWTPKDVVLDRLIKKEYVSSFK